MQQHVNLHSYKKIRIEVMSTAGKNTLSDDLL